MSEKQPSTKKSISPDWLVRGVLTKIGDIFDRLTGRGWKPSSSLATSELIERLKALLDSEAENTEGRGFFIPHNIQLKMQWDKFWLILMNRSASSRTNYSPPLSIT